MKKLLIATLIIVSCVMLASCSKTKASLYNASYWLNNETDYGVANINEISNYSVSFAPSEGATTTINLNSSSSYITKLTSTTYGEDKTPCYLLETTLNMVGEIDNVGVKTPIDDLVETKCYFLGIKNSMMPLYSERTVKAHAITLNTKTTYNVHYYDYKISTLYNDSSATVSFLKNSANEGVIDLAEGDITYSDLDYSAYIDNEMLLFAPRAMTIASSTSKSFNTIDAVSKVNRKMILQVNANSPTKEFEIENYFRNKTRVTEKINTYEVLISIDSKYAGSKITAHYAQSTNKSQNCALISTSSEAAYGLGTYTYTISSAESIS